MPEELYPRKDQEHVMDNPDSLPAIPRVTLGRSGIISSRLSIGCGVWPLKNPFEHVVDTILTAFKIGIRHIDVAPLYRSEQVIGRAIREVGAPPDMVMATKVCDYIDDYLEIRYRSFTDQTVYRSVERSLKWLQVDQLDIVHIHDVEPEDLPQVFSKNGALRALVKLKEQGVVRSIGMATGPMKSLLAAVDCGEIDQIQGYNSYTLLNQEAEQVMPAVRANNLSFINAAPYASFILLTGSVQGAIYNYRPATPELTDAVKRLEQVCVKKSVALNIAALAFSLINPDVSVTVIGASSSEKLRQRIKAFACPLTKTDFDELLAAVGKSFPCDFTRQEEKSAQ